MEAFPLRFNSLVVETTTRCNARCAMCYQSVGPKGSDNWGIAELDTKILQQVIRDARGIESLFPRFHVSGGEAFIDFDAVISLISTAQECDYHEITCTTNGFWGSTLQRAEAKALELRNAGLTNMELSWDYWHRDYISTDRVSNVLRAAYECGIDVTLRLLTSRTHGVLEALEGLGDSWELAERITWGPVFRSGRAAAEMDADEFHPSTFDPQDSCHSFLNLTVNAKGDVSPCCAGFDQTDHADLGNIRTESIKTIADRMIKTAWLRQLVFEGIASFDSVLSEAGAKPDVEAASMCQLCWETFRNADSTQAIKDHARKVQQQTLMQVLSSMGNSNASVQ